MIALSIQVEGQGGLTWPVWKQHVREVETLGFAGLFRSDHFTVPFLGNPDALELMVSLAYLADHSQTIHFGSLVAPLSFRDPIMLARQAAALDDLSGGRMMLGVGAGWMEREHEMFGYMLGDVPTRMARLEEGLEVITRLLRSEEPVTYTGRFYQLRDAALRPRPQRPGGPLILVGGSGPRRTLPLVARYADVWSAQSISSPEQFHERSARLDALLQAVGREPGDVRRTLMVPVVCGRDAAELDERMQWARRLDPGGADLPLETLLARLREWAPGAIVGTPDQVAEQIEAYAEAGVDEVMAACFDLSDFGGIRLLAEQVLPKLHA